ncbi:MAG: ATP-binding cassette domain-containing protein, partial [Mycobacteriales bacterium]
MLLIVTGEASAQLELRIDTRRWVLAAGEELVIGRGSDVSAPVADDRVSRRHAVIRHEPEGWVWEDNSRNGSWQGGGRVSRLRIDAPTRLLLGDRVAGVAVELRPLPAGLVRELPAVAAATGLPPTAVHPLAGPVVSIGREPGNSIVVPDLLVSRRHAEFRRSGAAWEVRDLDSHNGTFVNGQRVTTATVGPLDLVGIGHGLFRVYGDMVEEYTDAGDIAFQARDLVVTVGRGKRLLDGVGLALPPRSLLAVVGPSGAGKSTLLAALTGSRPADAGQVGYAGRDLYSNYEDLRDRIGLVPQQDILHTQLGVRRALLFAAKLRFPADVEDAERARRVDEVIVELGLTGQRDQTIASLSGGQRKRVSVALELLTKPSLLFLDEPTSGLDPGLDKAVMALLRDLADDGRTVVVVTHSVANLDGCDRLLVLAPGGRVAFFGPPGEALAFFGAREFADVFLSLDRG